MPNEVNKSPSTPLLQAIPIASVIILILTIVGGIVTITNPQTLSFEDYIKYTMAGAGLLGIGRGIDAINRP